MLKKFIATLCLVIALPACDQSAQQPSSSNPGDSVTSLYNQSCISCHSTGAGGAPRTHDVAAWEPRLEQGMETLLNHSKNGLGAMPPMGMCMQCSDEDLVALILFMSKAK